MMGDQVVFDVSSYSFGREAIRALRLIGVMVLYYPIDASTANETNNSVQFDVVRSKTRSFRTSQSNESKIFMGCSFSAPHIQPELYGLKLHLFIVEGVGVTNVGTCKWRPSAASANYPGSGLLNRGYQLNASLSIILDGTRVGQIKGRFSVRNSLYSETTTTTPTLMQPEPTMYKKDNFLPRFCFRARNRRVNWNAVERLDLNKLVENGDIGPLLELKADIVLGNFDAPDIELDPQILTTLSMTQLAIQYLQGCQMPLQHRLTVIEGVVAILHRENFELDHHIATIRAREAAIERENHALNETACRFAILLEGLDPKLSDTWINRGATCETSLSCKGTFERGDGNDSSPILTPKLKSSGASPVKPPTTLSYASISDEHATIVNLNRDDDQPMQASLQDSKNCVGGVRIASMPQMVSSTNFSVDSLGLGGTSGTRALTTLRSSEVTQFQLPIGDTKKLAGSSRIGSVRHEGNLEQVIHNRRLKPYNQVPGPDSSYTTSFPKKVPQDPSFLEVELMDLELNEVSDFGNIGEPVVPNVKPNVEEDVFSISPFVALLPEVESSRCFSHPGSSSLSSSPLLGKIRMRQNENYNYSDAFDPEDKQKSVDEDLSVHSRSPRRKVHDLMDTSYITTGMGVLRRSETLDVSDPSLVHVNRNESFVLDLTDLDLEGPTSSEVMNSLQKDLHAKNSGQLELINDNESTYGEGIWGREGEDRVMLGTGNFSKSPSTFQSQSSNTIHAENISPRTDEPFQWHSGRAAANHLTTGDAFDFYLSSITLEPELGRESSSVFLVVEFLDRKSQKSSQIEVPDQRHQQHLQFASHFVYTKEFLEMFKEELSYVGDELSLYISLFDAVNSRKHLGRAVVNLGVMMNHACSILQLETDFYADEKEEVSIGSLVVDVRGHMLLLRAEKA